MGIYQLSIELLSDLCVSDGGVYNSYLDTDICSDKYGFPYIPSKRIKGCLRESALELVDWGENIDIRKYFGDQGSRNNAGRIQISDARLDNWDRYQKEINEGNSVVYHKQNVLECFSYIRSQTSIERETGVAKENSLRNMRVANKGLIFNATIEMPDEYLENMKNICLNLKNIGMKRTRGLGEVNVRIGRKLDINVELDKNSCHYEELATHLEYEILLEEPVVCKSVMGAEQSSNDYIEGSKMLGVVAERCRKSNIELTKLLDEGKLIFSNAYICKEHKRYTEVPGYIYEIKNNSTDYVNKLYDGQADNNRTIQLNSMKHKYVYTDVKEHELYTCKVLIENRYHHRRPDDKSIGRAVETDGGNSGFYQISSITAGQAFKGYIDGNPKQIEQIYHLLKKDMYAKIGAGSSTEYGRIRITGLSASKTNTGFISTDESHMVVVTLNSPAIVYNNKASYSTDVADIVEEILYGAIENADLSIECEDRLYNQFIKYTAVGGYNVTWNKRKPTIIAFDKGSSFVISMADGERIKAHGYIGERNMEGYGEYEAVAFDKKLYEQKKGMFRQIKADENIMMAEAGSIHNDICVKYCDDMESLAAIIGMRKLDEYIVVRCIEDAKEFASENYRPVISNMLLMCEDESEYDGVLKSIEARYGNKSGTKKEKLNMAYKIINKIDASMVTLLTEFKEKEYIDMLPLSENEIFMKDLRFKYLKSLLQQIKYVIRRADDNGRGEAI